MNTVEHFLQNCRRDGSLYVISEPRFFQHPEEAYDAQYAIDKLDVASHLHEGNALLDLCAEFGHRTSEPSLEIGCGTGRLSLSLLLTGRLSDILLTDPSPSFCRITERKLAHVSQLRTKYSIAILTAEDMDKIPQQSFSLIVLRSVLHHVLDVRQFLFDCARALIPGGLLAFEEPCYEGYLVMGAITQFMPEILACRGVKLSDKHLSDIQMFAETMRFYARRDVDKSQCEDKHLFRTDELMRICSEYDMRMEFFPNRVFADIEDRSKSIASDHFERFYFDYIKHAMAWDTQLVEIFEQHAREYLAYFAPLVPGGGAPYLFSTFLCQKLGQPAVV